MQLRRAAEIVNSKDEDVIVYYKQNPVTIESVDNNIGTAYVKSLHGDTRFEVDLEQLSEIYK
ncbi:H-type small acid-soluble spore protein [Faecalimicrobium sp. JNUCC 81]